ncbi:T-cell-interacting, activating receptor on myeloid cells protein 1-like isoform X2 [Numida meleagris]|uniref:T-cell-interacting, activating receptor on myeloid cells protein 1-like isoform X2 n=1 Tax=Numida meleagris TaxID=8996 RepID=UPI000B3DCF23|nr:T-cell-interacting, activating receptor on myeloid cells protein 1-like isoform X2 [Numida meleagris]
MAPMALALILGWCLVAASRTQHLPQPSLSLHPSQGVSLGDNVTLRCHVPLPAARVRLYKDGCLSSEKNVDKVQDTAEFFLVDIKQEDAVKYWCQYQILEPLWTSNMSDPVELRVTGEGTGESRWPWAVPTGPCPITISCLHSDHSYPPPDISLSPDECVKVGMNVTIQCQNQKYEGIVFLHKDGHSAPVQHQEPDGGGTATFTLFAVTPADSGTYRCSYRVGGCWFLFSPLGNNVTLEVTMTHAPPGDTRGPHWNPVTAVAGGCAAAIVFILLLVVSFLLFARRQQIQRDESPGASPRSPNAVQFQVPPGDCEGLTYAELRPVTPGTCNPGPSAVPEPPIIYAEVGTGRPC